MKTDHDDTLTPGVEVFSVARRTGSAYPSYGQTTVMFASLHTIQPLAQRNQQWNQGDGALNGSEPGPRGSGRVGEKAPLDPHRAVYSGTGVVFQMTGLETISVSRRNGRGPDSSLKRRWIFVCTQRNLTDNVILRTVTHCELYGPSPDSSLFQPGYIYYQSCQHR